METPKEYYYTYYSYEEYGRGYIGSRTCKCLPEEDIKYFGSFSDKSFKPKQKIILKDDYITREEAYIDEIILQKQYKVVENPHFSNRAYQTTTKFCFVPSKGSFKTFKKRKPMSEEQKIKLGLAAKNRKMSEETKIKIGNAIRGKKRSNDTKKRMSDAAKNRIYSEEILELRRKNISEKTKGRIPWNKGLSMSEEFKKKVSEKTKEAMKKIKRNQL